MQLSKKYARLKDYVPLPPKWRGEGRILIDLQQVGYRQISGRQSGHVERFVMDDRDLDFFDDPVAK